MPVVYLDDPVITSWWTVWAEEHAQYIWFLPQPSLWKLLYHYIRDAKKLLSKYIYCDHSSIIAGVNELTFLCALCAKGLPVQNAHHPLANSMLCNNHYKRPPTMRVYWRFEFQFGHSRQFTTLPWSKIGFLLHSSYQNYHQSRQKLDHFLENRYLKEIKVFIKC